MEKFIKNLLREVTDELTIIPTNEEIIKETHERLKDLLKEREITKDEFEYVITKIYKK